MINRISQYIQRAPPRGPPSVFAVIRIGAHAVPVYPWMAQRVAKQLRRWWVPRWIHFTDVTGERYTVRATLIVAVWETTPASRKKGRLFDRALDREHDEDAE